MDVTQATQRKIRSGAENSARSTLMQATQMLRQFHRIGKSRSAGCRKALLRLLGEHLRDLRSQLVRTVLEASGSATDVHSSTGLIGSALESVAERFVADFGELLSTMEGATENDLAATLGREVDDIEPALEEALNDLPGGATAPTMDHVRDPRLHRIATTFSDEAYRCQQAQAHLAATVAAATALAAVLQDVLMPSAAASTLGRPADLLRSAVTRGLLPTDLVQDGAWLTERRHLLDTGELLRQAHPGDPSDAAAILDLLTHVCTTLQQPAGD